MLKQGLKLRTECGERDETLDRMMGYTGVVGVELVDVLVSINAQVPDQYTLVVMVFTNSFKTTKIVWSN